MIGGNTDFGKRAYLETKELKKAFELNNKKELLKTDFFEKMIYDVPNEEPFLDIAFDGEPGVVSIRIDAKINLESSYKLIVELNNCNIFEGDYSSVSVINEMVYGVINAGNQLKIYLQSLDLNKICMNVCIVGKISNFPHGVDYLLINQMNVVSNIRDIGKKYIFNYYANVNDFITNQKLDSENEWQVVDCKIVKFSVQGVETEKLLMLVNQADGLYIVTEDGESCLVCRENISNATIVPLKHDLCSIIVSAIRNKKLEMFYFDKSLNLLISEIFNVANIGVPKKITCAVDYSSDYSKIVLNVIDSFNNTYLIGCFDYSPDCASFYTNVEPRLLGKAINISSYIVNNELISYLQSSANVFTKVLLDFDSMGGGYYFTKRASANIKNVNGVYNLNGVEVYLKNGKYYLLEE